MRLNWLKLKILCSKLASKMFENATACSWTRNDRRSIWKSTRSTSSTAKWATKPPAWRFKHSIDIYSITDVSWYSLISHSTVTAFSRKYIHFNKVVFFQLISRFVKSRMSDKVKLLENTSNLKKNNVYKIAAAALFLFGLILILSSKAETVDLSTEEKYKSDRSVNDFPYPEINKVPFGPRSVFDTNSLSNQANYFHEKT